jgi:hypothetical protein
MDTKTQQRLARLHAVLGSSQLGERESAWAKMNEILRKDGYSWNDLPDLLRGTGETDAREVIREPSAPLPLERLTTALGKYLHLQEHEYLAIALWIAHTFVFDRFMVSPRLALASPVRRCGKTTALSLLATLCHRDERLDGLTPAAIYRLIDSGKLTLLCDEADTYRLHKNDLLRGVFNSGHRRGGRFARATRDGVAMFSSYAPMAMGVIGSKSLPLTVLDRSIVIRMTRADPKRGLHRFDELSHAIAAELEAIHKALWAWSRGASLNSDPQLPPELHHRAADNWRPLISIADTCGHEWGRAAREAAIALSGSLDHEDPGVMLLRGIRQVFDVRGVDRIFSQALVEALVAMEGAPWSEWRGKTGDRHPHPLTQIELANVLHDFDIAPKSIWPLPRTANSKSQKGYYRRQFEAAWGSYCGSDDASPADELPLVLRSA